MALPPPSAESIALVTGASSDIGEQFTRQLVSRGYRVVVTARRQERLQDLCAELGSEERAVAVGADLAVPEDRDRLAARIEDLRARVDIVVNNAGYAAAKAYVLWLSEAVHAEVAGSGVSVTAVCPGPVPTEFQATNDADYLVDRLPSFTHVSAERVVADALKAADRGRASVVPGGALVELTLGSSRFVPTPLALPVVARMLKR